MQRAGGGAALAQVALSVATLAVVLLGAGGGEASAPGALAGAGSAAGASGEVLRSLQALEVIKALQAAAGLVLVFGLTERLYSGPAAVPWRGWLGVGAGAVAAALLLAGAGVGYASLTLFDLFPGAAEAPGATVLPVSVVASALNAVVSGLGTASVCATGCWAVLAGWAGWRSGRLSQPLSGVLLAWGTAGILAFAVPGLVLPALALSLLVGVWLGAVLLSRPVPAAPAAPAAGEST